MGTLIYGRSLLTGRLDEPEIMDGGLIVEGERIAAVGPVAELRRHYTIEREIGGAERVVLPGLVSAHQHGGGLSALQLGCSTGPFERWLIRMLGVIPVDPYLDTLYHAVRFIECGITTTIHSHYTRNPDSYDEEVEGHLRAWRESGMRTAFAPCFLNHNQFVYDSNEKFLAKMPADLARDAKRLINMGPEIGPYLELVTALRKRFRGSAQMRILLGPVAPQWCTRKALERMAAEGEPGAGVHAHLLESPAQRKHLDEWLGRSVVAWLDELGFLSPASSYAHAVWLRREEIELLAARGAHIVHCPSSNLHGNGIAPIPELLEAGATVALATDDATQADDDDLFPEARLTNALLHLRGRGLSSAELLNMMSERVRLRRRLRRVDRYPGSGQACRRRAARQPTL